MLNEKDQNQLWYNAQARVNNLCARYRIRQPNVLLGRFGAHLAGYIDPQAWIIYLNYDLFRVHYDFFLREVIPHELAHLWILQDQIEEQSHGREWHFRAQLMGAQGKRHHNLKAPPDLPGTRAYCRCPGSHVMTEKELAVFENGKALYCPACHAKVSPTPLLAALQRV